jgi:hypothetical protein
VATEGELRALFATARILQREADGELHRVVVSRGEFNVKLDDEDDYVQTVITDFLDSHREQHARTHHYERRDGSIAASGLLDPKRVLYNGQLYYKD